MTGVLYLQKSFDPRYDLMTRRPGRLVQVDHAKPKVEWQRSAVGLESELGVGRVGLLLN
jgi:hypothetical protein